MFDIDPIEFNKLKQKTEEEYKKISYFDSPALKAPIHFNSEGFYHLRYDNNRSERTRKVQRTKFLLLNKTVEILKTATTVQEYRRGYCRVGKPDKSGFRRTSLVEWFGFLAITSFTKQTRINIVIRRVGDGHFHFWSVMPSWNLTNNIRYIGSRNLESE